jgi:phosphohistidine phosphatase SixA
MSSRWTQPIRRIRRVVVLLLVLLALSACGQPSRTTAEPLATSTTAATTVAATLPVVTATAEPAAPLTATPARAEQPLWSELREGRGMVVLLRHARTVPGTGDPPGFQLNDCTTQRNLSEAGRAQAQRIGAAFRAQAIPVDSVLSSQYCRCLDTAALLDLGPVTPAPLLNSFFADRSTAPQQTEELRQAILAHREQLGVIVMVTHMVNIVEVSGISPQQGEAVVVRGTGQGEIAVVGRLLADVEAGP